MREGFKFEGDDLVVTFSKEDLLAAEGTAAFYRCLNAEADTKAARKELERSNAALRNAEKELAALQEKYDQDMARARRREHSAEATARSDGYQAGYKDAMEARAAQPDSVVYFLDFGETIKIGYSTNFRSRLKDLKPKSVFAVIPGHRNKEADLHKQFKEFRQGRSEQFEKSAELLRFVADLETDIAWCDKRQAVLSIEKTHGCLCSSCCLEQTAEQQAFHAEFANREVDAA